MDKYFSGNAFKFIIFFNLLPSTKEFWISLALSWEVNHTCSVLWLAVRHWCHHSCARAPLTQDQAWVDRESWWSASWYQQSQIGVVWFCQLKTYPITLNLFIYHHGTGPRCNCINTSDFYFHQINFSYVTFIYSMWNIDTSDTKNATFLGDFFFLKLFAMLIWLWSYLVLVRITLLNRKQEWVHKSQVQYVRCQFLGSWVMLVGQTKLSIVHCGKRSTLTRTAD